jgi:hypothetical protein
MSDADALDADLLADHCARQWIAERRSADSLQQKLLSAARFEDDSVMLAGCPLENSLREHLAGDLFHARFGGFRHRYEDTETCLRRMLFCRSVSTITTLMSMIFSRGVRRNQ